MKQDQDQDRRDKTKTKTAVCQITIPKQSESMRCLSVATRNNNA